MKNHEAKNNFKPDFFTRLTSNGGLIIASLPIYDSGFYDIKKENSIIFMIVKTYFFII